MTVIIPCSPFGAIPKKTKIQFAKTNIYHSLEIGPGDGMFSMDFRTWKSNFFLDILLDREKPIRKLFPRQHQKYLKFYWNL